MVFFFLMSDLLAMAQAAPQYCQNATAMEYHKFVYAGHQHANHQL
jgi:hypothetical protein